MGIDDGPMSDDLEQDYLYVNPSINKQKSKQVQKLDASSKQVRGKIL